MPAKSTITIVCSVYYQYLSNEPRDSVLSIDTLIHYMYRSSNSRKHVHVHVSPPADRTTVIPTSLNSSGTLSETNQCSPIKFPNKPTKNKNDREVNVMNCHTSTTARVSSGCRDKEVHNGDVQRATKDESKEKGGRVWTPDREMIDNHLEMMRKRVSVDVQS